ncbi:MAG: hypothetical protein KKE11_03235 [Gammaproteobacteria bacterium]|nr:hypothetical protein [Gammaproteobacteria bacterium]
MNPIIKTSVLIFLSALCISCSLVERIDTTELHNKKTKQGLAIFRAIYFEDGSGLTEDSQVSVWAWGSRKVYQISRGPYWRPVINDKKIDQKLFIAIPSAKSSRKNILKPEYFYDISILAEGEYELWGVTFRNKYDKNSSFSMSNPSDYHFHITAGAVNYIGDLYILSPTIKEKGWLSPSSERYIEHTPLQWLVPKNKYTGQYLIVDRHQEAQNFVKKFYPEINLPFTKNIIKDISN